MSLSGLLETDEMPSRSDGDRPSGPGSSIVRFKHYRHPRELRLGLDARGVSWVRIEISARLTARFCEITGTAEEGIVGGGSRSDHRKRREERAPGPGTTPFAPQDLPVVPQVEGRSSTAWFHRPFPDRWTPVGSPRQASSHRAEDFEVKATCPLPSTLATSRHVGDELPDGRAGGARQFKRLRYSSGAPRGRSVARRLGPPRRTKSR